MRPSPWDSMAYNIIISTPAHVHPLGRSEPGDYLTLARRIYETLLRAETREPPAASAVEASRFLEARHALGKRMALRPADKASRYTFDRSGPEMPATLIAVEQEEIWGFATTGPSQDTDL